MNQAEWFVLNLFGLCIMLPMKKWFATISYISAIVILNMAVVYLPMIAAFGQRMSPADILVGIIYLGRDFAQQELRHYIFLAMLVGAVLSYVLATPTIALASMSAFIVGELIDWALFTFTRRPLSQRLVLSAVVSSPFDSAVFLGVIGRLTPLPFFIMTFSKIMGVMLLWALWYARRTQQQAELTA